MNEKVAKAFRREEKAKKEDFEQRKLAMIKVVEEATVKYRIDLVPVLQYNPRGVQPLIAFVDVKAQYEQAVKTDEKGNLNGRPKETPKILES